jgi:hypothetical protein
MIHRISASLQYGTGTARMIHNIPLGKRVKTRISKEEYGERLQAQENGGNIESDDEADEEFDEVSEGRDTADVEQNEQQLERELYCGGGGSIHAQQGEEKDEVENDEIYAQQNETKAQDENFVHNAFGKQRSTVTNVGRGPNRKVQCGHLASR